ncbi:Conserved hypothetical protein [gamma proteobacterium HdN1]|nr:Conserved hypothetical protein [gamma proteobacterium HdN1]
MKNKQQDQISWHYPRLKEAEGIMAILDDDLTSRLALFAPRRRGKTVFVTKDVAPLAQKMGYSVLYINFWLKKSDPAYCIAAALIDATEKGHGKGLRQFLPSKTDLSVSLDSLGVRLEKGEHQQAPQVDGTQAIALLDTFLSGNKKTLILFDEAQQLAMSPQFEDVVFGVRTLLDKYSNNVRSIFTGSSRDGLNHLFRQRNAALFNSAQVRDFGTLGSEFCQHMCTVFAQRTGRKLEPEKVIAVFKQNHRSPYLLNEAVQYMVLQGCSDIQAAVDHILKNDGLYSNFESDWRNLLPVDRAVLVNMIQHPDNVLYSEKNYASVAALAGVKSVKRSDLSNAMTRLRNKGYLYKSGHGAWNFEDEHFKDWIVEANRLAPLHPPCS